MNFDWGLTLALVGAGISVVVSGIGSSMAIRAAGQKGAGVLAEQPDLFGKILLLTALPGSQGVYGLLIAILILAQTGMFADAMVPLTLSHGVAFVIAGLIMGVSAISSAALQGKVVVAAIGGVARNGDISGKLLPLAALIETYAILGLLIAIFIANFAVK